MLYRALLSILVLSTAEAAPALHRLTKRHSDCWGSNLQGCSYSTAGYSGAAVSVSLTRKYGAEDQEVGTCSSIGVDILAKGGNAADGMSALQGDQLMGSDDSFFTLCWDYQRLSFWYWRGKQLRLHAWADQQGGFMLVRYKNDDGSHGYEMIDFRETMPSAGNETVCLLLFRYNS
jgi:gamma-glutamyltranspeptidase/glutathione hydrolase